MFLADCFIGIAQEDLHKILLRAPSVARTPDYAGSKSQTIPRASSMNAAPSTTKRVTRIKIVARRPRMGAR